MWDRLADRLREMSRSTAREVSPPPERYRVQALDPLVVEQIEGDLVLEEGDDDVEIAHSAADLEVGDLVLVHTVGDGYVVTVGVRA